MSSHRRPGVLARALRLRRPPKGAIPVPRRAGVEVVDARTRVAHQVSPEELRTGRAWGDYQALCGARLLAASLTDPGCGRCPGCAS
ncbi:MAG: hypothetical protein LC808_08615 [Actinobacteria bacterium]|nr:hypothetical protein [Actinomycetota bacterium]